MATGVPQYHRPGTAVRPGAAPALVPDTADGRPARPGGAAAPVHRSRPAEQPDPSRSAAVRPAVACAGAGGSGPATGTAYDTVTVSMRHGLETVDILRLRRACGAASQSSTGATVSFLVPAGTATGWHLPGSSCTPGAVLLPATDPRWVMPPAGSEALARPTDPWVLRSALCEAACTLTAGGLGPF